MRGTLSSIDRSTGRGNRSRPSGLARECTPLPLSSDPGLVHYLKVKTTEWKAPLLAGVLDIDFRQNRGVPNEQKVGWERLPLYNSAFFLDPHRWPWPGFPKHPRR